MSRFVLAAEARDVLNGRSKVVDVEGRTIAIFNVDGTFIAVDNACPHLGGPLGDGQIENGRVRCPLHGWTFDLLTGENLLVPHVQLEHVPVRLEGGEIYVDMEAAE